MKWRDEEMVERYLCWVSRATKLALSLGSSKVMSPHSWLVYCTYQQSPTFKCSAISINFSIRWDRPMKGAWCYGSFPCSNRGSHAWYSVDQQGQKRIDCLCPPSYAFGDIYAKTSPWTQISELSKHSESTSLASIIATLIPTSITAIIFLAIFVSIRNTYREIYAPRTFMGTVPEK